MVTSQWIKLAKPALNKFIHYNKLSVLKILTILGYLLNFHLIACLTRSSPVSLMMFLDYIYYVLKELQFQVYHFSTLTDNFQEKGWLF